MQEVINICTSIIQELNSIPSHSNPAISNLKSYFSLEVFFCKTYLTCLQQHNFFNQKEKTVIPTKVSSRLFEAISQILTTLQSESPS